MLRKNETPKEETYLYPDIVGHMLLLNQPSHKFKICFARRRIRDFNFLQSTLHQSMEENRFLLDRHGVGEGLVSIS